jgi:transcriptional regulator with XRE-family HTH domain
VAYKRQRLAEIRKAAGYTQEGLAEALGVERSTVVRWERAETQPQPWHRPHLSRLLGITAAVLAEVLADVVPSSRLGPGGAAVMPAPATVREVPFALEGLRAALTNYRWQYNPDGEPPSLDLLRTQVTALHEAYQRADYAAVMPHLPPLLATLSAAASQAGGDQRPKAQRLLASSYLLASKLACKAGDAELGWLAADRAATAAGAGDERILSAMAVYQVGCAFLKNPTSCAEAEALAATTADDLAASPLNRADHLSARGSLLLLAALAAARQRETRAASHYLATAAALAERLGGDLNELWTGFGPTNVRIHEISVAVELDQPDKANALGSQLDPSQLPPTLVSRRAQVHLDLATASTQRSDGDAFAVLHLLEVERAAPQVLQVNAVARAILHTLLGRQRQRLTPGLRPLAQRAGVLV